MSKTKIEWVKNADGTQGKTWNVITGCTPVGAGCDNCYCLRMFDRKLWDYGPEITFHPDRLDEPRKRKVPTTYFVCSMADLFHKDVQFLWFMKVMEIIKKCPQHTFIILTKRPKRMNSHILFWCEASNFGKPLPNLRLYVSIWDQPSADEFISILLDTPAAVRGVSLEPMLGPVDFGHCKAWHPGTHDFYLKGIHHVILGGETGPGARPMHPDWARSVRDQCQAAGVPFFFKQWGEWAPECNMDPVNDFQDAISINNACYEVLDGACRVYRIGKKRAGNVLDGRTWEEMP